MARVQNTLAFFIVQSDLKGCARRFGQAETAHTFRGTALMGMGTADRLFLRCARRKPCRCAQWHQQVRQAVVVHLVHQRQQAA